MIKKTVIMLSLALVFSSCASSSKQSVKSSAKKRYQYSEKHSNRGFEEEGSQDSQDSLEDLIYSELSKRQQAILKKYRVPTSHSLGGTKFDIPIVVNDRVQNWIDYFVNGSGRKHYARYLARSTRFVPTELRVLKENGAPKDLIFLSMMESGFNTHAFSSASAAGLWQFIRSTGKLYGLESDFWLDERRDPEKASSAAARHLKDLYVEFGDWYLAFAGYNAGAGKVRRAIEATGSRNFWDLAASSYLRQETKDYVPKILAAAIIGKSPEKYGFTDVVFQDPIAIEKVTISTPADIYVLAECVGVDVDFIRLINPELTRNMTPPNRPNFQVNIPKGTKRSFEQKFARLSPSERLENVRYVAHRKDTFKTIARANGISIETIERANPGVTRISEGVALLIPKTFDSAPVVPPSLSYPSDSRGITLAGLMNEKPEKEKLDKNRKKARGLARNEKVKEKQANENDGEMKIAWKENKPEERAEDKTDNRKTSFKTDELASSEKIEGKPDQSLEPSASANVEPQAQESNNNSNEDQIAQALAKVQSQETASNEPLTVAASEESVTDAEEVKVVKVKKTGEEAGTKNSKKREEKSVYYQVKKGENLTQIAERYKISVSDLKEWNNLERRKNLWVNEKLLVKNPSKNSSPVARSVASKPKVIAYKVQRGDTIIKIAKRYDLKPQEILSYNKMNHKNTIRPGLVLKIPSKSSRA
ncbi:MAG: LysM peptidoglycan-binding domain-containing protein [Deltaproteobacteria bacterium]|nr:LysM peptidoglycan-binding domain-containing protein [Deltaproteobacteria bacterium]